jgi:hypothetical protein
MDLYSWGTQKRGTKNSSALALKLGKGSSVSADDTALETSTARPYVPWQGGWLNAAVVVWQSPPILTANKFFKAKIFFT